VPELWLESSSCHCHWLWDGRERKYFIKLIALKKDPGYEIVIKVNGSD
jgi:hypothetical protein